MGRNGYPHILPLYVSDKKISREISYQIVGTKITPKLKKASNKFWPKFPLQVGLFNLANYKHAKNEISALNELKLTTIPFKYFDPSHVAQDIANEAHIKNYIHERNHYDDFFSHTLTYESVCFKAK